MASVKLQSVAEAEKGSLFSICLEGDSISEFEKFVQKHNESYSKDLSNVQKITSAIFLLQFMFSSIAKNQTK